MAMKVDGNWTWNDQSFLLDLNRVRKFIKDNWDVINLDSEKWTFSVETSTWLVKELSMDILEQPVSPSLKDFSKNPVIFGKIMEWNLNIELDIEDWLSLEEIQVVLGTFKNDTELHKSNLATIIWQVYLMKQLWVNTQEDFNKYFFILRNQPIWKFCKELLSRWENYFNSF